MLKTLRFIFVVSLLLLLQQYAFAAIEPYQNFLKGSIKAGDSLLVKDEKFKNPSFNWADITNISVKNSINLQIVDEQAISQSFSCRLKVRIEYFTTPAQTEATKIEDVELTVNYDKKTGAVYKGIDTYTFQDGYYVKVYVVSVNSPEFGTQMPPVLQLSSMISIDRKYAFKPYLFIGINGQQAGSSSAKSFQRLSSGSVQNNQLTLSWQLVSGAEEYDIEWVSVDSGSEWEPIADALKVNSGAYSNDDIAAIFRNNATRVTTHENNYVISLLYSSKYVLVRMRQVQYTLDGLRNVGDWFYKQDDNNTYAIWEPSWHQQNLNWQYSAAYAEEGKKKEVVSYFDGSLRGRQTVTLNNGDDVAVVQENVYDEFGRAAASILPAPVRENTTKQALHYFPSFNKNANGISYSFSDLNAANCEPLPGALNTSSGASQYYSGQNQFRYANTFNQYIPDAGGYPLSVTQYTPDNTGRIKLQGGVGYTFQPGTPDKHTTQYFYSKPEQWELDRLFGNDVGFAEHYLKNMVVDPNGQISISYLNAGGKTIATALTGNTPGNVSSLDNKPDAEVVSMKILKPEQFNFDGSSLSLHATTTYMASVTGPATLKYDIEKLIAEYPGTAFKPCSNCYYELGITIRDNCNNIIYSAASPVKIGSETSNCNDAGIYSNSIETAFNQIGEYYITFNFNLSEKVINYFTDEYVRKGQEGLYIKKQSDFVLKYLMESRFQDCFSDCKTARAKLGSKADFTTMFVNKLTQLGENPADYTTLISGAYDGILNNITAIEASCVSTTSPCDSYRTPMLADVSPGGQYAMVDEQGNILQSATNVLQLYFKHGAFNNLDKSSTVYQNNVVTREDGSITSPYDASFSLPELVKYWKPEWAEQFLGFHPEYCKLQFCMDNAGSKKWDDDLKEIDQAAVKGYNRANATDWLLNTDPFFADPARSIYKNGMLTDLTNFSASKGLTGVSAKNLSAFVDFMLYCADQTGTTNSGSSAPPANWDNCSPKAECRVVDREWQSYRDYYLELKLKYTNALRDATTCGSSCIIGKPVNATYDNSNSGSCFAKVLPGSSQQLTVNSYRVYDYVNNQQTTYTYIAGSADFPPVTNCTGLGNRQFYPCIDVSLPSAVPVRYTNVWEISCIENIASNCPTLYADGQSGFYTFYTNNGTYRYEYTFTQGSPDNPPFSPCSAQGDLPVFTECYTVYYNGFSQQFDNVWVIVCPIYLGGGGGGGGGGNPCDLPASSLLSAVDANTSNLVEQPHCEILQQLKASNTADQQVMADYESNTIYRISKVNVAENNTAAKQARTSNKVAAVSNTQSKFGEYELKPYFAVQNEKGSYKIYRNVWVAKLNPDSNSFNWKKNAILEQMQLMKSSNAPSLKSANSKTSSVAAKSMSSQTLLSTGQCVTLSDNDFGSYTISCMGQNYQNSNRLTTIMLSDGNGSPVNALSPIVVVVNYETIMGRSGGGTNYAFDLTLTINPGQSSASYEYTSMAYADEGLSYCVADQQNFSCVKSISGANFCSPVLLCDGGSSGPANCPPVYAEKDSRFDPAVIPPAGGRTEDQYKDEQKVALANQINNSCSANADTWIQRLSKGLEAGNYGQDKINELRSNLINLCIKGGDLKHPFGASSASEGITIGNQTAYNFEQVIKFTLGIGSFNDLLNPWLIDSPYPHEVTQQPTQTAISATNDVICTKLSNLRPAGYGDQAFYNHLKSSYGNAMNLTEAEFNVLLKGCTNCKHLLDYDIKLPVFLEEGATGCITKSVYNTAMANLNAAFGGGLNASWSNYETIVSNFLNQKFGFFFAYNDYAEYANSSRDLLCNEPPYVEAPQDPLVCIKSLIDLAYGTGHEEYTAYINEERRKFVNAYVSTCAAAKANVELKAAQQTYHYTLYYYDLAGNLIRTVPPEGVTFLTDNEIELVQRGRKAHPEDCSYNGPISGADQNTALQSLSNTLQSHGNNAVEMWLYANAEGSRQFIGATPDMKYMLQACVNGNLINIDVFTLNQTAADNVSITLSNHVTANVSDILPLSPWTHVVVQGTDLAQGALQIWVNGKAYAAVPGAPTAGCGWAITSNPLTMPRNFANIKHLRMYSGRLMSAGEIAANAASPCFAVADGNALAWYRFNVPAAGEPTTIDENSTLETQFNGTYPLHKLTTTYAYNSTNQVVKQNTPDGGTSKFWYDYLSRLVISQNAKQAAANNFSYTNYDVLGRIREVGQKTTGSSGLTEPGFVSDSFYSNFLYTGTNREITQTYYDGLASGNGVLTNLSQNNLRKRVSASIYREDQNTSAINATYYNYDVSGNVKTLYQQINGLDLKTLNYEYDLISGKVNVLGYQQGQNDAFYYQYKYDADNRLTEAWSSTQANLVAYGFGSTLSSPYRRLDAKYQYYLHGPLARMELGREGEKVQGVDYAYTLQGWLKGINGSKLDPSTDIGGDAGQANNITIAKDALAYSLGYYNGDYTPIGGGSAFANNYSGQNSDLTGRPLFNGNISNSTYAIAKINNGATTGYSYGYDQLNRIKDVRQHDIGSGNWNFGSASSKFKESFTYDGNGNILALQRNNQSSATMDNLSYAYNRDGAGKLINNRLAAVSDAAGVNSGSDIGSSSYAYDEIGNLKTDAAEGISNIDWSVYGKIKSINKNSGNISYTYDPSGNRVSKTTNGLNTYYVRDAQGNNLAVYDVSPSGGQGVWREQQLYGSSRLGMWKPNLNLATANGSSIWNSYGLKFFELSNHLGNVMAVVSDNRLQTGSTYEPDVINSNDYYAFGGQMTGRDFVSAGAQAYRYGFNGKENDNEVKGAGNQQDYGMRIYDPRLGKFLSVDPITAKYPELTPYQFASNNPIGNIDLDGLEGTPATATDAKVNAANDIVSKSYDPTRNHVDIRKALFKNTFEYLKSKAAAELFKNNQDFIDFHDLINEIWNESFFSDFLGRGDVYRNKINSSKNSYDKAQAIRERSRIMKSEMMKLDLIGDGLTDFFFGAMGSSQPKLNPSLKPSSSFKLGSPFTEDNIKKVTSHLARFGNAPENEIMIGRMRSISSGELRPTKIDYNFVAHELRESQLMKMGMNWNQAHHITLKEQKMSFPGSEKLLYTKEALKAGDEALMREAMKR